LPSKREQLLIILRCMANVPWSWGRRNLVGILRGSKRVSPKAQESEDFGKLAFRSTTAIGHLLDDLERVGFLEPRELEHGGVVLDLTPAGSAALQNPEALSKVLKV